MSDEKEHRLADFVDELERQATEAEQEADRIRAGAEESRAHARIIKAALKDTDTAASDAIFAERQKEDAEAERANLLSRDYWMSEPHNCTEKEADAQVELERERLDTEPHRPVENEEEIARNLKQQAMEQAKQDAFRSEVESIIAGGSK